VRRVRRGGPRIRHRGSVARRRCGCRRHGGRSGTQSGPRRPHTGGRRRSMRPTAAHRAFILTLNVAKQAARTQLTCRSTTAIADSCAPLGPKSSLCVHGGRREFSSPPDQAVWKLHRSSLSWGRRAGTWPGPPPHLEPTAHRLSRSPAALDSHYPIASSKPQPQVAPGRGSGSSAHNGCSRSRIQQ
jgi:hypothetical protein